VSVSLLAAHHRIKLNILLSSLAVDLSIPVQPVRNQDLDWDQY